MNEQPASERKKVNPPRNWKRWSIWALLLFCLGSACLLVLVFQRFHFTNQAFPLLSRIQWNRQSNPVLPEHSPQIIGHRGSAIQSSDGLLIGNTANAIQNGIDSGADWIEIDIRQSRDEHLIVFHDSEVDVKTNGEGGVASLSLRRLKQLDVVVDPPEKILTLDEAFSKFHTSERNWVFDLKVRGIEKKFLTWIENKITQGELQPDQFIIFGTSDVVTEYCEAGYTCGYTVIWRQESNRLQLLLDPSNVVSRCKTLGCRYLVLPALFATSPVVDSANSEGIKVWVYGTDDERDLIHFANIGVSGLIVDQPQKVIKLFANLRGDEGRAAEEHNQTGDVEAKTN